MLENSSNERLSHSVLSMDPLQLALLVSAPFVSIFTIINFSLGMITMGSIELLMVITLTLIYLWSRRHGSSPLLANLYIFHPALLFALLFQQGGFSEIGFIWSFGFPFIACLAGGSRIGLIWTLVYAVVIATLGSDVLIMDWQHQIYIALGYIAFSMIAVYSMLYREKIEAMKSIQLDQTAHRLHQEELLLAGTRSSQRAMLDAVPFPLGILSEGKWIYCNLPAALLFGVDGPEYLLGKSILPQISASDHEMLNEQMAHLTQSGRPSTINGLHLRSLDGKVIEESVYMSPLQLGGAPALLMVMQKRACLPNAEKDNKQVQIEHSQRLESLGVLAGGIAHDFNNLLAAIMGNAELAKRKLGDHSVAGEHLINIVQTCEHAAELCRQMLAYAGKGSYRIEVLDLNEMVRSMGRLIRASVGSQIAMRIKLDSNLPGIEADSAQVQQVLLNFIVNSAEAIGNQSGEIKVTTGVIELDRKGLELLYNGAQMQAGRYVVVEVRDTGCGMDEATKARIFDPFFTTKETGSGLGLSAVLGIVSGHGGGVYLKSAPGRGTVFRVFFPAATVAVPKQMVSTMEVQSWKGSGKVLLVDDDLRVLGMAAALLESLEFEVVAAEDGRAGVERFQKEHTHLAAVLLDMTMPVMSGAEAMAKMRAIDASVPIVLISGYSEVEAGTLISGERPDGFLQKPFKIDDVKKVLFGLI